MADWKMPLSYNLNPSYHAYAYGLMYPQASEHGHQNLSWAEAAYTHTGGVTGTFYASQSAQQSPPWSPENTHANHYGHYPGATQNGRVFISYNKTEMESKVKDAEQAESDPPSDSEAHTPDSWSSGSSREGSALTNLNLASWKDQDYESDSGSPDGRRIISNVLAAASEEPAVLTLGADSMPTVPTPRGRQGPQPRKTRAAFSEVQMNALIHRFNVQRYLTPAEMKTLAGTTGLTYKQVKTWFQNRRMKLKRHQRDSSWMTERYVINGTSNTQAPSSQAQSENHVPNQDPYINPQLRESIFKSPPQAQFYPGYSNPGSPPQTNVRPSGNWPHPPAVMHYDFPNPSSYIQARVNASANLSINASISGDVSDTEVKENSPTRMPSMPNATQWST